MIAFLPIVRYNTIQQGRNTILFTMSISVCKTNGLDQILKPLHDSASICNTMQYNTIQLMIYPQQCNTMQYVHRHDLN